VSHINGPLDLDCGLVEGTEKSQFVTRSQRFDRHGIPAARMSRPGNVIIQQKNQFLLLHPLLNTVTSCGSDDIIGLYAA
jgi:hypothetical protein